MLLAHYVYVVIVEISISTCPHKSSVCYVCHYYCIKTSMTIDLSHKSHNAPVPYPTMHRFVTEMCKCVHIYVSKWCIVGYLSDTVGFVRWVHYNEIKLTIKMLISSSISMLSTFQYYSYAWKVPISFVTNLDTDWNDYSHYDKWLSSSSS